MPDVAGDGLRSRVVDARDRRSEPGRREHRAPVDHALDPGVDAVDAGPAGLLRDVQRSRRRAHEPSRLRRLDRERCEFGFVEDAIDFSGRHDLSEAHGRIAGDDAAVLGARGRRIDAEEARTGLRQGDAPGGAGSAEQFEVLPDRPAPAGDHEAPLRIAVHVLQAHRRPVRLEFVGDDARQRRADVLAHLRFGDAHGDDAIGVDRVVHRGFVVARGEGVARGGGGGIGGCIRRAARRGEGHDNGRPDRAGEEAAARERERLVRGRSRRTGVGHRRCDGAGFEAGELTHRAPPHALRRFRWRRPSRPSRGGPPRGGSRCGCACRPCSGRGCRS